VQPVVVAAATALGAWLGVRHRTLPPVALWLPVAGLVVGLAGRRRVVVYLTVGLLAVSLAQRSMAGLDGPLPTGPVQAELTMLTDPEPMSGGSVRAEVGLDGRRLAAVAHRSAAAALDGRLAGERIVVRGRVLRPGHHELARQHRHLAGRLQIETVMGWRPGHAATRAANGLRRTLERGAASLPGRQRSLLMGLTLGDDRHQPPDLTDAFRAAGLGHLTAASGQNVAFVLAAAAPVLLRVRFAPRLVLTLGLLAGFALLTRGEPSVLRATGMAAVGAFAAATGRPTSSLRTLALAVAGLLLCDPLLVSSLGFQLSVAGAAGIIVGASPIECRLPGPRWLTLPLAITCAAQLAVAPLLIAAFGPLSLASLPANLVAVPAAGPVMVWGLTGGLAAGVMGEPFATVLHAPTRLLLTWIEAVALTAARWPLGSLGGWHLALLVSAVGLAVGATWIRGRGRVAAGAVRGVGVAGVVAVLGAAVLSSPGSGHRPGRGPVALGAGMVLWRDTAGATALVIDGRAVESDLGSRLGRAGIRRLDLLVVRTGARQAIATARAVRARWPAVTIVAPRPSVGSVPGALAPPPGGVVGVGDLRVRLTGSDDRLSVTVTQAGPVGARWASHGRGRLRRCS
jgi:competence protein ComEC